MAEIADSTAVRIVAAICISVVALYIFLALFQPSLKYKIPAPPDGSLTSPEFLRMLEALADAKIKERGVEIKILCPGKHSDHYLTRRSSRRLYGELLAAGAKIYEYKPSMLHAKVLTVDGTWSVVGSTNFDNRSFGLNDEVNVAALDRDLAARLEQDFQHDISESDEITYQQWKDRSVVERAGEYLGWLIERQQ